MNRMVIKYHLVESPVGFAFTLHLETMTTQNLITIFRALTTSWSGPSAIMALNLLILRPQYLDLDQMFCCERTGGEGTLGVVTKVSILVPAKLSSVNVAFLACEDFISCQVLIALPF